MQSKNTLVYFILIFLGGGTLLFRGNVETTTDLIITIVALIAIMFGMAKVSSIMRSASEENTKDDEDQSEFSIEDVEEE